MRTLLRLVAVLLSSAAPLVAQATPSAPALDFSGVLFGNFQWRTDAAAKAATGGQPLSRFDVGRAYLNFRMAAGNRGSIRVTTDIFQQSPSTYYSGWAVRLKYGYFQYDLTKSLFGVQGMPAVARVGMLHTVIVDHVEVFWPRFLGPTAIEQYFGFSSSDVGLSTLVTMPRRRGEIYITAVNGSNYSSAETDRFKDFAARATFTPFANDSGFIRTLAITPWYSLGWSASAFTAPPNSISDGLQKDRRGVFVGLRDRRLTGGVEFSQRAEQIETAAPPARTVVGRTGNLLSGFAFLRPLEIANRARHSPWGLLARFDSFDADNSLPANAANPQLTFIVLGTFWDLNNRVTLALDYQEQKSDVGAVSTFPTKTLFLHWQASF